MGPGVCAQVCGWVWMEGVKEKRRKCEHCDRTGAIDHSEELFLQKAYTLSLPSAAPTSSLGMPKDECRESRPVPFDRAGTVWAAAAENAVSSIEVDEQGRFGSPLKPTEPRLTAFQRQNPPFSLQPGPSNLSVNTATWGSVASVRGTVPPPPPPPPAAPLRRAPLAPLSHNDVAVKTLINEVNALELKSAKLAKHVKVQQRIINGFCQQELARKEN